MPAYDDSEFSQSFRLKTWKRLLPFMRPFRKEFLLLLVFNFITALVDILLPLFQKAAISRFINAGTLRGLAGFGGLYLLVIAAQAVAVMLFARASMNIEMNMGRDMRNAIFHHLQTLSFSFYNVTPVGYLITRLMSDTNRIGGNIAWIFPDLLWGFFYVLGSFAAMLLLNARLAVFVLAVVPAMALLTALFQGKILRWNRKVRKLNSQITGAFNEGISGAKTTKTLVTEERSAADFSSLTASMAHAGVRAARLNGLYIGMVIFFSTAAVAVVLQRGGGMVLDSALDIAVLSAFVSYAIGIFEPIQNIAANLSELISLQASIERITDLLDKAPDVTDTPEVIERYGDCFHPKKENWEPLRGEIEFRDVTFRYPDGGENVLEHFNLHIPQGTTVAIVGETGAGKSTLVNLACRFFEPTEGQIFIDGKDYRERSLLWLHSGIGYVLQSPHLFSGSVRDNIRYGRPEATDEDIKAAAKAVCADAIIEKLEDGWDSDVGEGGDLLSTGEKQLISFARAILTNPRIFVLDEATSSIDTQTEQLIQQAIDRLLTDRTSFLIAHRLSTIRKADLILVVRDGKIVEQGTHEALLRQKGYYHNLYLRQFAEESAARALK